MFLVQKKRENAALKSQTNNEFNNKSAIDFELISSDFNDAFNLHRQFHI